MVYICIYGIYMYIYCTVAVFSYEYKEPFVWETIYLSNTQNQLILDVDCLIRNI